MTEPTVLIVPGLRDHVDAALADAARRASCAARGRTVATVPPMGRADLDCAPRVAAIERAAQAIDGPTGAGRAQRRLRDGGALGARRPQRPVHGALLATPPDFEQPMPEATRRIEALRASGWLPVPREPLPFREHRRRPAATTRWAASSASSELARDWGSRLVDLGEVGHLNPASGYGDWPRAEAFIDELSTLVKDAA